eukprot:1146349-Pelagomonas_calceolata.AAC.1
MAIKRTTQLLHAHAKPHPGSQDLLPAEHLDRSRTSQHLTNSCVQESQVNLFVTKRASQHLTSSCVQESR